MSTGVSLDMHREGILRSRGFFHLDEQKALEKLREFRLPGPHYFLLELIKGAYLLEGDEISLTLSPQKVTLRFKGEPLEESEVERLYSAPFSPGSSTRQRALRHLAIGLHSSQAAGVSTGYIEVGQEKGAIGAAISTREIKLISPRGKTNPGEFYLSLKCSLGSRLLRRFRGLLTSESEEIDFLRERVQYSPRKITVNGELLSRGYQAEQVFGSPHHVDDEKFGTGVLTFHRSRRIELRILQQGVWVETLDWATSWMGTTAIIEAHNIKTDLSQTKIIADQALQDLKSFITAENERASLALFEAFPGELSQEERREVMGAMAHGLSEIKANMLFTTKGRALYERAQAMIGDYNSIMAAPVLRELRRIDGLAERIKAAQAQLPFKLSSPDKAIQRREPINGGAGFVSVVIDLKVLHSEILYLKEGRIFHRDLLHSDLKHLQLIIHEEFEVNDEFDGPRFNATLEKAFQALVSTLYQLVYEEHNLPATWYLTFLEGVVTEDLAWALQRAFRWRDWPPELKRRLQLSGNLLGYTHAELMDLNFSDRLKMAGFLADLPLYKDIFGGTWSLSDLRDFILREEIQALAVSSLIQALSTEFLPAEMEGLPIFHNTHAGLDLLPLMLGVMLVEPEKLSSMIKHRDEWKVQERNRPTRDSKEAQKRAQPSHSSPKSKTNPPDRHKQPSQQEPLPIESLQEALASLEELFLIGPHHRENIVVHPMDQMGPHAALLDGHHLLLQARHPAVKNYLQNREDPIALAFLLLGLHASLENPHYGSRREFVRRLVLER